MPGCDDGDGAGGDRSNGDPVPGYDGGDGAGGDRSNGDPGASLSFLC